MKPVTIEDGAPGRFLLQGTSFAEHGNYGWLSADSQR